VGRNAKPESLRQPHKIKKILARLTPQRRLWGVWIYLYEFTAVETSKIKANLFIYRTSTACPTHRHAIR